MKKIETDRIVNTLKALYRRRFRKTKKDDVIDIISLEIKKRDSQEDIRNQIFKYIKDLLPEN